MEIKRLNYTTVYIRYIYKPHTSLNNSGDFLPLFPFYSKTTNNIKKHEGVNKKMSL